MNKVLGLGILLFTIGLVVAILAGIGSLTNITVTNMVSQVYNYLIEAIIAIAFMVAGGILILARS